MRMASRKKAAKKKESRENVPDIFVQLRDISARCLEISLPSAHGGLDNVSKDSTGLESCMQIIQSQNQVRQQLMDMRTDLSLRLSKEDLNGSLNINLNTACAPLQDVKCSVRTKEIVLKRMQTSNLLVDVLQKSESQRQCIIPVMDHSLDLCQQIVVVELSNRQMEEQLDDIRRKRMEIRIRQQELLRKLKSAEKSKEKIQAVEMKVRDGEEENVQRVSDKVIIIQEVFQRLVMCSQVNWAEDPRLTTLLLGKRDPTLS
ncbi:centromere protein H-like [Pseudophryne corroboree]|uniref:centromere protein H-like n=1 Tax=Pseudophryne corroboree TaxID=495146 RepID=UPI0030821A14